MIPYPLQRIRNAVPLFSMFVLTLLVSCASSPEPLASTQQVAGDSLQAKEDTTIQSALEETDFYAIVQKQMELEPYMVIDRETKIVTFNEAEARADGHEESIIALSREMVAYQNQMMTKMREDGISDVTQVDVSIELFPLVQRFQERASERARADMEKAGSE
jgi:hypothetical protein